MKRNRQRAQQGQMAEFAAAILVLVCFIIVPILNLSFIPIRYMMCEGALTELTRRLAHAEKLSEAASQLKNDQSWKRVLNGCGINASGEELNLVATTSDGKKEFVARNGSKLPDEWLPGGANSPCIYSLVVNADCAIPPLFQGPIPPITMNISGHCQWENMSKDPSSHNFFINE